MRAAIAGGALLGVASRLEEVHGPATQIISTRPTWLAAAVLAGLTTAARTRAPAPARQGDRAPTSTARAGRGAAAGTAALVAANAAWYAWVALTEPGTDLLAVAGSPLHWLLLSALAGVPGGATGAVLRGPNVHRAPAHGGDPDVRHTGPAGPAGPAARRAVRLWWRAARGPR